jgi:phospholipid transport system transporter-binding protein
LAQIIKEQNRWLLSGDMTIEHMDALLAEKPALVLAKVLEIDMSAVTDVDTATISLLLEWLRHAMANGVQMSYSHLPANFVSLATLYGVQNFIPQTTH